MFLDPLFHGKGDGDQPEWPPSPLRLFQALLAGARSGCRSRGWSDAKAEAFTWLEQRNAPVIIAPEARSAAAYTLFVPNNDGDKTFDRQKRLTSKIAHPHHLCDGDTLHYLWPIDQSNDPVARSHAEVLCQQARYLLALGWGIDQVVGNGRILSDAEVSALPGQRWRPWAGLRPGQPQWRVSKKTLLHDLERVHQSFIERVNGKQYRPPLKLSQFDTVAYISSAAMPPRSYAVFELPEGVSFRQVDTARVGAMLRSLACRCAKTDTHEFCADGQVINSEVYVAGHVSDAKHTPPRFSYLPLPSVGHEHADGMIRRLLIAEPLGGDGSHARWVQNRLRGSPLTDENGSERGVLLDLWRRSSATILRRYVADARTWSTVTPVILPGFDDGKHAKAERLFLTAVRQAELPIDTVEEFALRKAPFWPNSQHPSQYHIPAYLKNFPRWHVRLAFREPIRGPLALGAGRHCGLGLFATVESS
jgi:CRISPR-associated protein Csb2